MSVEDIVDGLAIIQQKRGRIVDQGDVEMLALAIRELRKGRPGTAPEAARTPTGFDFGSRAHYAIEKQWEEKFRDELIEEIAGQTKMREGVGWCLTDVEIRAMKSDKCGPQHGSPSGDK